MRLSIISVEVVVNSNVYHILKELSKSLHYLLKISYARQVEYRSIQLTKEFGKWGYNKVHVREKGVFFRGEKVAIAMNVWASATMASTFTKKKPSFTECLSTMPKICYSDI